MPPKIRLAVPCVVVASVFALLSDPASAEQALNYEGTVGTARIGMTLYTGAAKVSKPGILHIRGKYFYKAYLKDIQLDGETDGKRGLTLYEYGPSGERVAVIKGTFPETDPESSFGKSKLDDEVFIGTWSKINGEGSLPLSVRMTGSTIAEPAGNPYSVAGVEDVEAFEKKVQKFRTAVIASDRKQVASMIRYPITVNVDGKKRTINNSGELVRNYAGIFTPKFTQAIKNAAPHNLFARYDGVMLGQVGEVWFNAEGTVEALNN